MKKKYGFKLERTMRYSTQTPTYAKKVDSGKRVRGSVVMYNPSSLPGDSKMAKCHQ